MLVVSGRLESKKATGRRTVVDGKHEDLVQVGLVYGDQVGAAAVVLLAATVIGAGAVEFNASAAHASGLYLKAQNLTVRSDDAEANGNPPPKGTRTWKPAAANAWSTAASPALP